MNWKNKNVQYVHDMMAAKLLNFYELPLNGCRILILLRNALESDS